MSDKKNNSGIGLIILGISIILLMFIIIFVSKNRSYRNTNRYHINADSLIGRIIQNYSTRYDVDYGNDEIDSEYFGSERYIEFDADEIDEIKISLFADDLKIIQTSSSKVSVSISGGDDRRLPRVDVSNGILTIAYPSGINHRSADLITVQLPKFELTSINASTMSGDITYNASNQADELVLKSISGDINARNIHADEITCKSTSGDIKLDSINGTKVNVGSISGDVDIDGDYSGISCKTTSGEIEVKLNQPLTERNNVLESISGSINVKTDNIGGLKADYSTVSGSVWTSGSYRKSGSSKSGTISNGTEGSSLSLRTTSGRISIVD